MYMGAMSHKRRDLSISEKIDLLKSYDALSKMTQREAAERLKISQSVLSRLLKSRYKIERSAQENASGRRKRKRGGKDNQVENALKGWFTKVREKDGRVSGELMKQKAEQLAKKMGKDDFKATHGWFQRWLKRENVIYRKPHGEQADADTLAAYNWINDVWPTLSAQYKPCDVYNEDETGLYYRALPDSTYMFKNDNTKGAKTCKERITVMCCSSMSGEKRELLVIGKSKKPRCFKGVKSLPVDYVANQNAWMTSLIFSKWLQDWDKTLQRTILLLIDNRTAHNNLPTLNKINVVFLPANTTFLIQPMDMGVIRTMKAYYRREMRGRILEQLDQDAPSDSSSAILAKKTSLLDALHLVVKAWDTVSSTTIINCFKKGGFASGECEPDEEILMPPNLSEDEFSEWMSIDDNAPVTAILTEDEACAEAMGSNVTDDPTDADDEAEESSETPDPPPPSHREMLVALDLLRRGVQHYGQTFADHYRYERYVQNMLSNDLTQSKIDKYFSKA